jgi:hypothetical protein
MLRMVPLTNRSQLADAPKAAPRAVQFGTDRVEFFSLQSGSRG